MIERLKSSVTSVVVSLKSSDTSPSQVSSIVRASVKSSLKSLKTSPSHVKSKLSPSQVSSLVIESLKSNPDLKVSSQIYVTSHKLLRKSPFPVTGNARQVQAKFQVNRDKSTSNLKSCDNKPQVVSGP